MINPQTLEEFERNKRSRKGTVKIDPNRNPEECTLPLPSKNVLIDALKSLESQESELMAAMVKYRETNRLEFFNRPNPLQAKLLDAWDDPNLKVFTFTGANRIGKCLSITTPIDTTRGKVLLGDLYEDGKYFKVLAWDGKKRVEALASPPFKKDREHKCFRLEMYDGSVIEAADEHRILSSLGWIYVSQLQAYSDNLPGSTLEHDPLVLQRDVCHSTGRSSGFQDGYFVGHHRYGEQPRFVLDNGQVFVPSRVYAQRYSGVLCSLGAQGDINTSIYRQECARPSIQDDRNPSLGLFVEFLYHIFYKTLSSFSEVFRLFRILSDELKFQPLSNVLTVLRQSSVSCSYDPPFKIIGDNRIINITPISARQEVYDFEVPGYQNYFTGGIVHHNTTIGAVIALSTLFGGYLWNGKKLSFPHKYPRKVRYIGQDWEKQIKAVVIPELEKWWPAKRKVLKKKNSNGIDAYWTDVETGSILEIMSNGQEDDLHEGWSGDLVIYDEPPKRGIRVANARGLVDRRGREIFCMTRRKEPWVHREVIQAKDENGKPDMTVFNIHGDIFSNVGYGITEEGVKQFAKTLTDEEKDARLKGIPSYMSGLVYPQYDRRVHLVDRFKIPLDWLVDIAIDIHPRERQAVLFVATSPSGVRYAVNEIWGYGDGTWVGEEVVRCVKMNVYRVNRIIIDPLSKGDQNNQNTVFEKVQAVLFTYGYFLETASKDKSSGILLVKDHLKGPNNLPSLFVFNDLVRFIFEIEGYMWDKETQNPMDKDDHMMENLYRILLLNTIWCAIALSDEDTTTNRQGRSKIGGY